MKTCFFFGHREIPERLFPLLMHTVEQHIIAYGVTAFVVGGYGGFDRLAARCVIALKERYPHITLTLLLPYHPAERPLDIPPGFDDTYYPDGMENVPRRFAIVRANRYMIDRAEYIIAYAWHIGSNAYNLLEYAKHRQSQRGLYVTNLATHMPNS